MGFLSSFFGGSAPRALVRAAKAGDVVRVQQLLDAGVPVDARAEGVFPLFAAAFYGHLAVVRLLRERGAALDVMVDESTTALHALAQLEATPELCGALLEGAEHVDVSTNGLTPLMLACQFNRRAMVDGLLDHGADANATLWTSVVVESIPGDLKGFTPIVFALHHGNDELVPVLLAAGARLGARLAGGATELIVAAAMSGKPAVEALLDAGADPNARVATGPMAGATALLAACTLPRTLARASTLELALFMTNRMNVVRALLEGGADADARAPDGRTVRDLVAATWPPELARQLFELAGPLFD